MKKAISITWILLSSILLVSCVKTQAIERIGIVNAQGLDAADNDTLENTLVVFQFSAQSDTITKIIHGKGKTLEGTIEDAEHSSMFPLLPGKLKLTLFGEEIAKKGILPLLDAKARDTRVPDLMYLSIGKPTANEILSVDESNLSVDAGQFLYYLIENHTSDHNIPRKTLQDFLRIYYDIGQDNVLPIFELVEDTPKQNGAALFMGDRLVGELTNDEINYINLMDRKVKEELMELKLPIEPFEQFLEDREHDSSRDELKISFIIQKGSSKTKMTSLNQLEFVTDTRLKIRLVEQSAGIVIKNSESVHLLEKEIAKKMEENFEELLNKVKKHDADPFGYGLYYKKSREGKDLTREEWREKFPKINVQFNVDVELTRHGAID